MNKNIEHIFVDLDGTLVRTDLFLESLVQLIARNPFNIFHIIRWISKGRSFAKERVANCVTLYVEHLSYSLVAASLLVTMAFGAFLLNESVAPMPIVGTNLFASECILAGKSA